MPSIPSGGILGNLGQNMSQPWREEWPELMSSNVPDTRSRLSVVVSIFLADPRSCDTEFSRRMGS
jgi:hypothetical protein